MKDDSTKYAIVTIIIMLLVAFSLFGCQKEPQENPQPETPKPIIVCTDTTENTFTIETNTLLQIIYHDSSFQNTFEHNFKFKPFKLKKCDSVQILADPYDSIPLINITLFRDNQIVKQWVNHPKRIRFMYYNN